MVAPAQAIAPAQSYEPAMADKVNPQPATSGNTKLDTKLFTSLHEPPLEPPIYIYVETLKILQSIEGVVPNKTEDARLSRWLEKKGISKDLAEEKAWAMKAALIRNGSGWQYQSATGKRRYTDLRAVLRGWITMKTRVNDHVGGRPPARRVEARTDPHDFDEPEDT